MVSDVKGKVEEDNVALKRMPSERGQITFFRPSIGTGAHRTPATCGTNQGNWESRFAPPLRTCVAQAFIVKCFYNMRPNRRFAICDFLAGRGANSPLPDEKWLQLQA